MSNDWFEQRKRLCSTIFHYVSHWIWHAQLVDILQLEISNPFAFTLNTNRTLYQNLLLFTHVAEKPILLSCGYHIFDRQHYMSNNFWWNTALIMTYYFSTAYMFWIISLYMVIYNFWKCISWCDKTNLWKQSASTFYYKNLSNPQRIDIF